MRSGRPLMSGWWLAAKLDSELAHGLSPCVAHVVSQAGVLRKMLGHD